MASHPLKSSHPQPNIPLDPATLGRRSPLWSGYPLLDPAISWPYLEDLGQIRPSWTSEQPPREKKKRENKRREKPFEYSERLQWGRRRAVWRWLPPPPDRRWGRRGPSLRILATHV